MKRFLSIPFLATGALIFTAVAFAQRPPAPDPLGWFDAVDADKNGTIELSELTSAAADAFARIDRNKDGSIDDAERPRMPKQGPGGGQRPGPGGPQQGPGGGGQRPPQAPDQRQVQGPGGNGQRPGREDERMGPEGPRGPEGRGGPDGPRRPPFPYFVMEAIRETGTVSKAAFDAKIGAEFKAADKNSDGVVSREEARARFEEVEKTVSEERGPGFDPLASPTAQFAGEAARFGDKLVKGAPFSAEISVEDTRRLFDGSTATKKGSGAIYRDGAGRTRREQPVASIGGFNVVGDDGAPQKLVFINDFVGKSHYFLDPNRKVARRDELRDDRPQVEPRGPRDEKSESLGTKTIDGVTVEGTRRTREIPAGELGNDKPIQVVTETWFSPELQVVVMSRHLDPLAGEHVFKLVNIRRGEPDASLFTVPSDYKVETAQRPGRREE